MFEKMRTSAPIYENLFYAAFLSGMVLLLGIVPLDMDRTLLIQQMLMIAGGVLVFGDVLDGANIARRGQPRVSRASVMYGVTLGSFWAWAMSVMMWTPTGGATHSDLVRHFIIWIVAGGVFGVIMTLIWKDPAEASARARYYKTERPFTVTKFGRLFQTAAPILGLMFLAVALFWQSQDSVNIAGLWFGLLILWTSAPTYRAENSPFWMTSRPYGIALALVSLLAF